MDLNCLTALGEYGSNCFRSESCFRLISSLCPCLSAPASSPSGLKSERSPTITRAEPLALAFSISRSNFCRSCSGRGVPAAFRPELFAPLAANRAWTDVRAGGDPRLAPAVSTSVRPAAVGFSSGRRNFFGDGAKKYCQETLSRRIVSGATLPSAVMIWNRRPPFLVGVLSLPSLSAYAVS